MVKEWYQKSPLHEPQLIEMEHRPIGLCMDCCNHAFGKVFVEGVPLNWFHPALLIKDCECPCHDAKKARAKFITLGPQGYLLRYAE